jgi:CHASE2 domain-containing sensor protein
MGNKKLAKNNEKEEKEMSIKKSELDSLQESIGVLLYSIGSILYYTGVWVKKNYHRFVHLIWAIGFAIVSYVTTNGIWMWIGVIPALIYVVLWMVWLRRIFDAK